MTVGEFIANLQELHPDFEIAVFSAHACARAPVVERANVWAFGKFAGLTNPAKAYLIRPEQEII